MLEQPTQRSRTRTRQQSPHGVDLAKQRWFGAKTRSLQSVRILDWAELASGLDARGPASFHPPADSSQSLPPILAFCEFSYANGLADTYQLSLVLLKGWEAQDWQITHPNHVIASFGISNGDLVLAEAVVSDEVRKRLLDLIEQNVTVPLQSPAYASVASDSIVVPDIASETIPFATTGLTADAPQTIEAALIQSASETGVLPVPLTAQPGEAASPPKPVSVAAATQQSQSRELAAAGDSVPTSPCCLYARGSAALQNRTGSTGLSSRVGSAEQSNTSILYGDQLILKLFRRLQPGENPDVEVGRFLTEVARFPNVAPFLGEISITGNDREKTTTAMLQGLIANQGDGWQWFLDQLSSFLNTAAGELQRGAPI